MSSFMNGGLIGQLANKDNRTGMPSGLLGALMPSHKKSPSSAGTSILTAAERPRFPQNGPLAL